MLSLYDQRQWGRREFLRVGGLGLGGLALSDLLSIKARAAGSGAVRDKSVIFLFLHGGPSQTETFDPKMSAPSGVRSVTGEVQTSLPGITFGGTFERLAPFADRTAIVRSFVTGDGNHDIKPIVSKHSAEANLGSLYSRIVGQNRPGSGMPTNVALFPQAVDPSTMPAIKNFGNFESAGSIGSAFAPFAPGSGGTFQENMKLAIPLPRLDDRRLLLSELDRFRFQAESTLEGLDTIRQQAFETILGGAADAFDLSQEDPKTLARYDTAPLIKPEHISQKWNNYKRYQDNVKTLGKLLLLARRLCEAGCGFVTVTTNFVWDMHADANNATMEEGMRYVGEPFDHAVSAFLEDVENRGLSEKILLVCCGEMGRTPKVNQKGGRDHWGNLAPLMLAGGGLNMGQVIGQSTKDAAEPLTTPYRIPDLISTILHTLFDLGELRLVRGVPNDIARVLAAGEPIPGLL